MIAFNGSHLFNVAFDGSFLIGLAMGGGVLWYAKRRPVGTPLSWGQAMLAAAFAFFAMLWCYGIVPDRFLTWADSGLKWRPDKILNGPGNIIGKLPFTVTYQTLRDFLVVGIYGIFLAMHMALWAVWQARGKAPAAQVESTYGRPLVKNG